MWPHQAEASPDTHLWNDSAHLPQSHPAYNSFIPVETQNGALTQCALQRQKQLGFNNYRLEQ